MTTMTNNGTQRKTLASQLDRLDRILDALSDGLNGAVASAVQDAVERAVREAVEQAVQQAVQGLVAEVLTNPDALALLRATLAPPLPEPGAPVPVQAPAAPPPPQPRSIFSRAWGWATAGLARVRDAGACVLNHLAGVKPVARMAWDLAVRFKGRVLAACGAGVVIALLAYHAGPALNAAAGCVGGFAAALAVQARASLGRLLTSITASD